MKEEIKKLIEKIIGTANFTVNADFIVEHPADFNHGDYSTNVALVLVKQNNQNNQSNQNPRKLADEIAEKLRTEIAVAKSNATNKIISTESIADIEKIEVAGPGFINFRLGRKFFKRSVQQILNGETNFGRNKDLAGKNIIIEYTDPNPFKQFHIGHLMPGTIGESIARILEWNGAKVIRVCYQGDVGLHVAKALWGMKKIQSEMPMDSATITEKTKFLGKAYVLGDKSYESDALAKDEIHELNKKIYELFDETKINDDPETKRLYEKGRQWSLGHFDEMYIKLGINFAQLIFEHEMAPIGSEIVRENVPEIFELSEGAVIYKGEKDGLHTRVFINSMGLPTYESKDIGLAFFKENDLSKKFGKFDASIVVTADEQKEYYKVILAALRKLKPGIAEKTVHITHGMLRFTDGKMSSRAGNIIPAEELINDIEKMVAEKIADRNFDANEAETVKTIVSVGAIKYSILKQAIGRDIIFDPETSISFEGDSGPYLQYTYARAGSIIKSAVEKKIIFMESTEPENWQTTNLEKLLYQFPEVVRESYAELGPQNIATLVSKICAEFNSFYAREQILDGDPSEAYKVAITKATMIVIKNGLKILGIKVPERM